MTFLPYPRRDAIKNYFPMPNEIFSMDLCAGEIALYAYLMYRENRTTYQCWPSYRTIGNALHMSKNTVRKYVHSLEEKGFIWTEPTKARKQNGEVRNGNLLFTIRPMHESIQQLRNRTWKEVEREVARAKLEQRQAARKAWISEHFSTSR